MCLSARDSEYEEILDKCQDFHSGLEKEYTTKHFTYGELEENEVELMKLRNWFAKVESRDVFGAPRRGETRIVLDACETGLEAYVAVLRGGRRRRLSHRPSLRLFA